MSAAAMRELLRALPLRPGAGAEIEKATQDLWRHADPERFWNRRYTPKGTAKQLEALACALDGLGPGGWAELWQEIGSSELPTDPKRLSETCRRLATAERFLVGPGRPHELRAARLAEAAARWFHRLTGAKPPKSDPSAGRSETHPYHRLVRDLFRLARLKGWPYHAREAAGCRGENSP